MYPLITYASPPAAKGPPQAAGTKGIPEEGDPNALAGLAIVFTGELTAFSRDEIIEVAKRFGGYVKSLVKPELRNRAYYLLIADE